ncbi:MAG: TatD family hydrolase, partial [Planctomycetota bacterium]|nr:TatD family hydrolase [Planctomycetota bacterium]
MQLIDTHAHLDQDEFTDDRDDVISAAEAAGIKTILAVGIG